MSDAPLATKAPRWKQPDWFAGLLVILLASVPFWQVASFSFTGYDDPLHVYEQPMVLSGLNAESLAWSVSATPTNLWHPLTWISYMAEVSWLGGGAYSPGVHHIGNLVLHLGACLFFFLLLRRLGVSLLVAALASLAFSMHPLHVEPVAWISSRKDVLCAFFSLASIFCYSQTRHHDKKSRRWFWLTMATAAAAMASKPSAVMLPCLFLLIDYHGCKAKDSGKTFNLRGAFLHKWPYFTLAILVAVTTVIVQYAGSHREVIGHQDTFSRLAALPASLGFYIQRLLWPQGLSFDYATPEGQHFLTLTIAGISLLFGMSCLSWQMRHRFPSLMAGWLWFLACLGPVLGFFYVGPSFTADRYTYLALAGPAITLAGLADLPTGIRKAVASSALLVLLIVLGVSSHSQARIWKNNDSLFAHGVSVQPRSDLSQTNWAKVCSLNGHDELALHHYKKALSLNASRYYIIYHHIALIYYRGGQLDKAIRSCRDSLQGHDHYAPSHHLLGQLLEKQGSDIDAALRHLKRGYELGLEHNDPMVAKYGYSYALAQAKRGHYPEAASTLQQVHQTDSATADDKQRNKALLEMLKPYLNQ